MNSLVYLNDRVLPEKQANLQVVQNKMTDYVFWGIEARIMEHATSENSQCLKAKFNFLCLHIKDHR